MNWIIISLMTVVLICQNMVKTELNYQLHAITKSTCLLTVYAKGFLDFSSQRGHIQLYVIILGLH